MTLDKATAVTITVLLDATGVSWSAGDVQASLDGAAFANTTNLPSELGSTSVYTLALTAAELDCDFLTLRFTNGSITTTVERFATTGYPSGSAITGTLSTTSFTTDLSSSVNDYWKDALILFATGNLAGQVKRVSGYNGTSNIITVNAAFTEAPANGDMFVLVNR